MFLWLSNVMKTVLFLFKRFNNKNIKLYSLQHQLFQVLFYIICNMNLNEKFLGEVLMAQSSRHFHFCFSASVFWDICICLNRKEDFTQMF